MMPLRSNKACARRTSEVAPSANRSDCMPPSSLRNSRDVAPQWKERQTVLQQAPAVVPPQLPLVFVRAVAAHMWTLVNWFVALGGHPLFGWTLLVLLLVVEFQLRKLYFYGCLYMDVVTSAIRHGTTAMESHECPDSKAGQWLTVPMYASSPVCCALPADIAKQCMYLWLLTVAGLCLGGVGVAFHTLRSLAHCLFPKLRSARSGGAEIAASAPEAQEPPSSQLHFLHPGQTIHNNGPCLSATPLFSCTNQPSNRNLLLSGGGGVNEEKAKLESGVLPGLTQRSLSGGAAHKDESAGGELTSLLELAHLSPSELRRGRDVDQLAVSPTLGGRIYRSHDGSEPFLLRDAPDWTEAAPRKAGGSSEPQTFYIGDSDYEESDNNSVAARAAGDATCETNAAALRPVDFAAVHT